MKRLFFPRFSGYRTAQLFSFLFFLSNIHAQWQLINEGPDVNNIFFTSTNIGWMTGIQMLLKTSDGGESWHPQQLDDDLNFYNIRFLNDTLGLAVAGLYKDDFSDPNGDYSIFRSEDGGHFWQEIAGSPGKNRDVLFVTDSIFFQEHHDKLFRTKDAGQSWSTVGNLDLPVFINSTIGFVSVYNRENDMYTLLRSIDGGENWQEMTSAPNSFDIRNLKFVNDSSGYLVGSEGEWYESHFYVTADTGRHWLERYTITTYGYIQTFEALSQDTLYAVFGEIDSTNWSEQILLKGSTDGGRSWKVIQELAFNWNYSSFTFDSQGKGYLLAELPREWINYDGAMVLRQSREGQWPLLFSAYPFNTLCFVNGEKGFAAGGIESQHFNYGDILKTTDGGKSWGPSFSAGKPVKDLVFTDEHNGFALASSRNEHTSIFKTDNGGDSWFPMPENYGYSLEDGVFYFEDKNHGWLAGEYNRSGAIILKTTDGGQTWETKYKYPNTDEIINNSIYDLQVVNSAVWAVGENGLVVKSVDSSSFTVLEKQTDLPLNKIFFTDRQHGWIAGGYNDWDTGSHSVLLRTKDGGQNWQKYSGTEFLFNDMFFEDSLQGWAAGRDSSGKGLIMETVDGGENWLTRMDGLRGELRDFYYQDSTLWAAGYYGLVLKKEGVTWTDINSGIKYPSDIQLFQNYPNPFNPVTTISYTVKTLHGASPHVDLSIYNLLGQKVATLVNKKQQAGQYMVEWDASGFASGVYFYNLETAQGITETRKLLLLK